MRKLLAISLLLLTAVFTSCTKKVPENPNFLNIATVQKIKGMDPAGAQDLYSSNEIMRVFEGLLQYHPLKRPYVLEPLLAESMPVIAKNGLVYTFKIKKGIRFHDDASFPDGKGREVKASDFVYSFKRLADPRVQSTGWWLFENRIKGLDEWHDKLTKDSSVPTNYNDEIEGLKALDDYTFQIELKGPYPQLLYALAMPYTVVMAKESVDKYGPEIINHAVGTGPFILDTYKPNEILIYKRNPNYWEATYPTEGEPGDKEAGLLADAGKKIPFVDGINVRVIIEDQPRWLHFLKGDLDSSGVSKDNFKQAFVAKDPSKPIGLGNIDMSDEMKKMGLQLTTAVQMDFTYTAFNLESSEIPQFKDKRVRQAISLAMDEKEAIQIFFNGMATEAQTPIPPGVNGYSPDFKNPYRTGDIEKAKKLLADAGYPGGKGFPEIPYDSTADATSRQMFEYFAKEISRIGLKLKLESNTWPAMLKRIQGRQTQLWGIAWGADYPDAENFLQLFYGPNASPGGMNNSYYKNKEFDAIFVKARAMQDSPARTELYKKLGRMVAEDSPVILGLHRIGTGLRQPWVQNSKYDEFAFNRAKYLRIDLETKKKYGK
ncbi:MAG: ABC transporter substrate-binding protein [Bdellovibrionota bacterium]